MGEETSLRSVGPSVSGLPKADRNIQMAVEAQGLERLIPAFFDGEESGIVPMLTAKNPIPDDPSAISFTLPEVVDVWFQSYTGAESSVNFSDLVKGIGCTSFSVIPEDIGSVKMLVQALANQVSEGGGPPMLDGRFANEVKDCLDVIFNNNEPISYRGLLAFTIGAFWLLGFVKEPRKKREGISPLSFVTGVVQHYGKLAFLPN